MLWPTSKTVYDWRILLCILYCEQIIVHFILWTVYCVFYIMYFILYRSLLFILYYHIFYQSSFLAATVVINVCLVLSWPGVTQWFKVMDSHWVTLIPFLLLPRWVTNAIKEHILPKLLQCSKGALSYRWVCLRPGTDLCTIVEGTFVPLLTIGHGGIMFLGCLSVRVWVCPSVWHLYISECIEMV